MTLAGPGARTGGGLARKVALLWRFGRPHTLIGTSLSVLGLYAVAVGEVPGVALGDGLAELFLTLLASLGANVYITGLNQLEDVEIDRINKPWLPLAAGELSRAQAWCVVVAAGLLPVVLAASLGWAYLLATVVAGMVVGTAYSCPPLRLKRFPALASLSIVGVRAAVVNLGVYAHLSDVLAGRGGPTIAPPVWALTLFVLAFSFVIAILKDVPDVEGDRRFRVATFSIRLGARRVTSLGVWTLTFAYAAMMTLGTALLPGVHAGLWFGSHGVALALLWTWVRRLDPQDGSSFPRFYMRVWQLFFFEYVAVAAACLAA